MAQAQYRVKIPTHDNLKNKLHRDLPSAAHHWLHYTHPRLFSSSWIEGPHQHHWRDDQPEGFHHLVTIADDRPETDSIVKQLGAHVGDAANQWGIHISKHGKSGVESWVISNPNYQPDQPSSIPDEAPPLPVAPQSDPQAV